MCKQSSSYDLTMLTCYILVRVSNCFPYTDLAAYQGACARVIYRGWVVSCCLCELGDNRTRLRTLTALMFLLSNKPFQCIFKISSLYVLLQQPLLAYQ